MSTIPRKMTVVYQGHTIEGDIEVAQASVNGKVRYELSLRNGRLLCGPHDTEGNHIEEEA